MGLRFLGIVADKVSSGVIAWAVMVVVVMVVRGVVVDAGGGRWCLSSLWWEWVGTGRCGPRWGYCVGVAVVVVNGGLSVYGHLPKVHSPGLSVMFISFKAGVEG